MGTKRNRLAELRAAPRTVSFIPDRTAQVKASRDFAGLAHIERAKDVMNVRTIGVRARSACNN